MRMQQHYRSSIMPLFGKNIPQKLLRLGITIPIFISASLFAADIVKIMPLGDSITHENFRDPAIASSTPEGYRSAYRNSLYYLLNDNNYTIDFVGSQSAGENLSPAFDTDHESYDGETDDGVGSNVYDYLTLNPADIVLLHIGTNSSESDNSPDDVEFILDEIDRYEIANSTHVTVALARIIGCREDWIAPQGVYSVCSSAFNTHLNTFNDNVQAMVQSRIATKGDDVIMVDMQNGAGLNYDASDMIDDLHPNDAGYVKMANTWYATLENVIPAHQWRFEETTSPYLDTYRDLNDATCIDPGCPADVEGVIGNAKAFDGIDDNLSVAHNTSYDWNATENFSVEFWMKPNYSTELEVAVGHYHLGAASWWIGRQGTNVKVSFGVNNIISDTSINISGKRWVHVVVVRNANDNTLKLYINGKEDVASLSSITASDFDGNNPINIGYFNNGYNFNGALDEVTIYNGILDENQINLHYSKGIDGSVYIQHNWKLDTPDIGNSPYIDEWNPLTPGLSYGTTRPLTIPGQIGQAQQFDGVEDRIRVEADTSIDWAEDANFTIELWVKPDRVDKNMKFLGRRGSPDPDNTWYTLAWYIGLQDNGKPQMYFRGAETSNNYPAVVLEDSNPLTANTWYHLSVVRDAGNTFTFYVDGVEVANAPDTILNIEANTSMTVGYMAEADGTIKDYLDGTLDDVAIFAKALNASEIKNHYNKGKAGLGFDDEDVNIPVISLLGSPAITLERGTPYTDAGATALDAVDGDLTSEITVLNLLDEDTVGTYLITYNVIDYAFNEAIEVNRTVTVVDTIAPVIEEVTQVNSPTSNTTPSYIFYSDEKGTITYGGTCTSTTTEAVIGDNNITFNALADDTYSNCTITVTDAEGHTSNVLNVTEFIIDILPPTLTEVTPVASPTADTTPEYTFTSSEAGTIAYVGDCISSTTQAIAGSNTITFNTLTTGLHDNCIIRVTDVASNEFTELMVSNFVVDDIEPTITLNGDNTINLLVNQTYIEAGATCTDNYDTNCAVTIGGDTVNTSSVGTFTVTYNTTDTAGNPATTLTRTVNVAAGASPVITVYGNNPFTVEVNTPFFDPGVSANDLEDGTNVTITSDQFLIYPHKYTRHTNCHLYGYRFTRQRY